VLPSTATITLDALLAHCVTQGASDIHLAPGLAPYFRIHGQLAADSNYPGLSPATLEQFAQELAQRSGRNQLGTIGSLDGAITSQQGVRFRFNLFRRQGQFAIALRRLEDQFRSLQELGFSNELYSLCGLPDGLVIVAGPTGAGKSTTLATLIDRINRQRACHIVTIEDPIEYLHEPVKCLVNQRQVGADTESFHDALVDSLRQDPDVILVGEIRELNTIRTAITAAETGHLVFTTVHAGDCVGTIERLVSVFPAEEQFGIRRQLSLVLRAVIAQHLLVCDGPQANASSETPSATARRERVVASEVLLNNNAVANLIATGKSTQIYSAMELGMQSGMQTLEEDLARLCHRGFISESTALAMGRNTGVLRERLQSYRSQVGASSSTTKGTYR
jgi:twitching motility protein PilT